MKKLFYCLIIMLFSTGLFFSQENDNNNNLDSNNFFSSVYLTDSFGIGKITVVNKASIGNGLLFGYNFNNLHFGTNLRVEAALSLPSSNNNIKACSNFSAIAGGFGIFEISDFFTIKPEIDLGITNSYIITDKKNNLYSDLMIQATVGLDFYSQALYEAGIAFNLSPFYRVLLEKSYIGQYLGLQAGIILSF